MTESRYDGRFPEPPYPEMPPDLSEDLAKAQEEINQLKGHIQTLLEERFTVEDRPVGDPEIGLEIMRLERDEARKAATAILCAVLHEEFPRYEIVSDSMAKWPWLKEGTVEI